MLCKVSSSELWGADFESDRGAKRSHSQSYGEALQQRAGSKDAAISCRNLLYRALVLRNQGDYDGAMEVFKVAAKLGEGEFRKARLLEIATRLGDTGIIPETWKSIYGNELLFYENYFKQNWHDCLTILDTTKNWRFEGSLVQGDDQILFKKAEIHYVTNTVDSSSHYATQLLDYYDNYPDQLDPELKAFAFSLLGKRNKAIALIQSGVYRGNIWRSLDQEDLWLSARIVKSEVYNYVLENDYQKATATLLALNVLIEYFGSPKHNYSTR